MWTLDTVAPVPHWRPTEPPRDAVLAFTTRRGGQSQAPFDTLNLGRSTPDSSLAVQANRIQLLATLGLPPATLATAGQVHGARVVRVTTPGHHSDCDALVTDRRNVALAVTTADCMALLYHTPGAVAAAHSGWRGTELGMPVAALDAVRELAGVPAERIDVHLGPCIRGCCYVVGEDVAQRFPAAAQRREDGRVWLDLPTATRLALLTAGVPEARIHDTGACTACEPHWYFSHRRDAGRTGRMWGIAALRDAG